MAEVEFTTWLTIPVSARPSHFVDGQLDGWGKSLEDFASTEIYLLFCGEVSEPADDGDSEQLAQALREASWVCYNGNTGEEEIDTDLALNLLDDCKTCIPDDIADRDDDGNGCDGTVLLNLGDEAEAGECDWECLPDPFSSVSEEVLAGIASRAAYIDGPDYSLTYFYDVNTEELHEGSPLVRENWEKVAA